MDKRYYVYILNNISDTVYYTGFTSELVQRIYEHKNKIKNNYSPRYNINRLLYYEIYNDAREAIAREKQIKGWTRVKKEKLIVSLNPAFEDLWDKIIK